MNEQNPIVTISGFIGAEPEMKTLPASSYSKHVFDPVADMVVLKEIEMPEKDFLPFSVAVPVPGSTAPRWIDCVDWSAPTNLHSGDLVTLTGYFKERASTSTGKTYRQFIVKTGRIDRAKQRSEEPAAA
jgi:hypothetical protein